MAMECKNNPELVKLADHLARPFMLPGQTGQPLSFRILEDGGMVVIAPDGRKLWFTALEVCRARKELHMSPAEKPQPGTKPVLQDLDPRRDDIVSMLPMRANNEEFTMTSLPESMKYIKERLDEHNRKYQIPRPKNSRR